ncbi:hypothetical protein GCL60_03055 [Silvanigrella paludirubra]|uniref:Peptidase M16 C-terminal domain-containing protein n=1 Tax=Silvanigrella paludirubra TaxID=2499159 RepID=A0A6N6VW88_9BACT|nr:insulinase family protein [Silvanigrella paludirubra]KAB8040925.1 hypothetical protein GCL60_03055 [Silvanigrella paludirubra]
MKYKLFYFIKFILLLLIIKNNESFPKEIDLNLITKSPIKLDWKNEKWEEIDFIKESNINKASLFTSELKESPLFYISIIFNGGKYTVSKEKNSSLDAMIKIFYWNIIHNKHPICISGGSDNLDVTFEYNNNGQPVLQIIGLKQYLDNSLQFLNCLIKNPIYDNESIKEWKKQKIDFLKEYLNANSHQNQFNIIRDESYNLAFNKYFEDLNLKYFSNITNKNILILHNEIMQSNGLKLIFLGDLSSKNITIIKKFINKIPLRDSNYLKWNPENPKNIYSNKIKAKIIIKEDMTQSNIVLNYFYPNSKNLNTLDRNKMDIISEVFYSESIGMDRFTKALRRDSGFSYSPYAYYNENIFFKKSEGTVFSMEFESPNDKISNTVPISIDTFNNYIQNGMTSDELNTSRNSIINQEMTKEYSILKTFYSLSNSIGDNLIPNVDPTEYIAFIDSQNNLKEINNLLKTTFSEPSIPVLVIIGNPSNSEIEKLKKDDRFEIIDIIKLDEYKNKILKLYNIN